MTDTPEAIPFPKDSMIGPPLKIGDNFHATTSSLEDITYLIVGEDGDDWLAIKISTT